MIYYKNELKIGGYFIMKKIENGLLIVLEGGEGVGKTTQAKLLLDWLNEEGYNAKYFREPGGNKVAEDIRNIVLYNEMDSTTETLLISATRNINVQKNLLPVLRDGGVVVLDRFYKSMMVYQGILKNGDMDFIDHCVGKTCNELLLDNDGYTVEFTLLCDPEVAVERAKAEGHERNKNDLLPVEDYKKINDAYRDLYKQYDDPLAFCHCIDTTDKSISQITHELKNIIAPILVEDTYEE
jgi:dTMP kinase